MLLAGLTGNYGMGKSTVLPVFKDLGALTIDADSIVHLLLKEKDIIEKVRSLLGDKVVNADGSLNKDMIAGVIFSDETARHSLEDILHPLVFERIQSRLNSLRGKQDVVIIEIPLLYERGYEHRFDRTITVYTDEEIALRRLEAEGINRQKALSRLRSQLPVEEKVRRSDFAINNSGTIDETREQVKTIYMKLVKEAGDGDNQRY